MISTLGQPVETSRFGTLTDYKPYRFTRPLLGFETYVRFALLPTMSGFPDESPLLWMQSLEEPELAFVLTQPELFALPYQLELPDDCLLALGLDPKTAQAADIELYTLVTIPDGSPQSATTNLVAPLVFAPAQGTAVQWVLNNSAYQTKTPLIGEG